jgi:hypothetical protein
MITSKKMAKAQNSASVIAHTAMLTFLLCVSRRATIPGE